MSNDGQVVEVCVACVVGSLFGTVIISYGQ